MSPLNAMKAIFLLVSLVLATPSVFASNKIVGGEPVTNSSEVPYMASLDGVCGASIIANKWLLTAAHCAGYFTSAKIGVLKLKETGSSHKVKRVITHPSYDADSMTNDFALVELETSIVFSKTISAVTLATPDFETDGDQAPGIDATVYGWGLTREGGYSSSDQLNKVVIPLVSNDVANEEDAYAGRIDETMLAAGYTGGGKDSCQGDSGGPLVVFDASNKPVQIGVVSWGEGCARANKYGIYSKISTAFGWIKKTMAAK